MFGFDIGGPEVIIVLVVVLVLFGGSQLPKLAKNLGKAQKEFKDGLAEGDKAARFADGGLADERRRHHRHVDATDSNPPVS